MAVFFYDVGQHKAGFVGFRVATTIGKAEDVKQAYFSLNEYDYRTAEKLAHQQDDQWRLEAAGVRKERLLLSKIHRSPGSIATGLRAGYRIDRRGDSHTANPAFIVQIPGYGKGQKSFVTSAHGYLNAYQKAVDFYVEVRGLGDVERSDLIQRCPSPEIFKGELWTKLIVNGHIVSEEEIDRKLNLPKAIRDISIEEELGL